ncbi:UPF0575 protein C19orf67 homolog [Genypterus blacodes]|uniref:UPF0575 protein C19orf67 homolog n=1 Tax=Genypterus blacodes TaxID=154954 RepID=UPI003F762433
MFPFRNCNTQVPRLHGTESEGQAVDQNRPPQDTLTVLVEFLYACQPCFNYLEATARSTEYQHFPPSDSRRLLLLYFSQELSNRVEQLVLNLARFNHICLEESHPHSLTHFCTGRFRFDHLRVSSFRYAMAVPYLANADSGWFKRMRWNVERCRHKAGSEQATGREEVISTEYYFLCYEDVLDIKRNLYGANGYKFERMWTIGQWIQLRPDPTRENIREWILSGLLQASYKRLLYLGEVEPTASVATDYLMQLLVDQQATEPELPRGAGFCVSCRQFCGPGRWFCDTCKQFDQD